MGVPMRIVELVRDGMATADYQGVKREISVSLLAEEVGPGDWVMVRLGYAMEVIDGATAEEITQVLRLQASS